MNFVCAECSSWSLMLFSIWVMQLKRIDKRNIFYSSRLCMALAVVVSWDRGSIPGKSVRCGGQIGISTGFLLSNSVCRHQYHCDSALYSYFIHPPQMLYDHSNWQHRQIINHICLTESFLKCRIPSPHRSWQGFCCQFAFYYCIRWAAEASSAVLM